MSVKKIEQQSGSHSDRNLFVCFFTNSILPASVFVGIKVTLYCTEFKAIIHEYMNLKVLKIFIHIHMFVFHKDAFRAIFVSQ